MGKQTRRNAHVKKLPAGRAQGTEWNIHTAKSTRGKSGFGWQEYPENDGAADNDGCVALWRAVLAQAIMDAKSRRTKPEYGYIRNTAIFWLLENTVDFTMVCDFAGYEPDATRKLILNAQARGFIWRAGDHQRTKHDRASMDDLGTFTPCAMTRAVQLELF
jgi:hypothetical protein